MKMQRHENGDLEITQGSNPVLVILGIMAFLFFSRDAYMYIFTAEEAQGNGIVAILVILLALLFFYRSFSLRSKFTFSSAEKELKYSVQSLFSNKKGVVPVGMMEKAIVQTDSDGGSRIVIKCNEKELPMSYTVSKEMSQNSIADRINEWLSENT